MERPPSVPTNPFLITHIRILDGLGNPVSEAVPITVKADGHADLSRLPEEMRKTFEAYGVKDEYGNGRVLPNEGQRFIRLLMKYSGRHWYCSTDPEPQDV